MDDTEVAARSRPTVLIVEDDYLAVLEIEAGLDEAGFRVAGATASGEQAVALAKTERPDLVIMDIRLRGRLDGIAAAIRILQATGIRCIFVTAHTDAATRDDAAAAEPLAWVAKPYTTDKLLGVLQEHTTGMG